MTDFRRPTALTSSAQPLVAAGRNPPPCMPPKGVSIPRTAWATALIRSSIRPWRREISSIVSAFVLHHRSTAFLLWRMRVVSSPGLTVTEEVHVLPTRETRQRHATQTPCCGSAHRGQPHSTFSMLTVSDKQRLENSFQRFRLPSSCASHDKQVLTSQRPTPRLILFPPGGRHPHNLLFRGCCSFEPSACCSVFKLSTRNACSSCNFFRAYVHV